MSKLLAFLSYGVNAGVMLAVALLLATTLQAAEYSRYSFAVATAQTVAVFVFEWLRLAATRYYPGPDPEKTPGLRGAFLGNQYLVSLIVVVATFAISHFTKDFSWFLIACYAVLQGLVDLQFTMLRFDARLRLFSKLQTFRGIASLILAVSAAVIFRHANAALIGGMAANVLTIIVLEIAQPGFVLVRPALNDLSTIRHMVSYGASAAAAGGLYQFGPFLMRCVAYRGTTDTDYAAFSLVMDLMQRPYNVVLNALNGVFFPDAVREHDLKPNSERKALQLLYAIQVWCLLLIFGSAMALRNELLPLLVKTELAPRVLDVFPYLSVFFLIHAAIQTTSSLVLHLSRDGVKLIVQAAIELGGIALLTGLLAISIGSGIIPVSISGMLGSLFGFVFTAKTWRTVPCRLPWVSWSIAVVTTVLLLVIGQIEFDDRLAGLGIKALSIAPIVAVCAFAGFIIPFGLVERFSFSRLRTRSTS